MNLLLGIAGTPYDWILTEELPSLDFASFNSVITVILGVCANGAVAIIALILVLILAWNYIKLLFEAAERYILLGVLVYTAPVAFATGASQSTGNIFKSWCRMLGGQFFLLLMNAWCLRLFTSNGRHFPRKPVITLMKGGVHEIQETNPHCPGTGFLPGVVLLHAGLCGRADRSPGGGSRSRTGKGSRDRKCVHLVPLCYCFPQGFQKIDSFMASLGINVGNTGGNMMAELLIAGRGLAGAFHGHGVAADTAGHPLLEAQPLGGSFLSGGLAGAVGRQVQREAVNAATHYSEGPSVGNMLYQSSLKKGGDFATHVISNIAQGNYGQVGSIKGEDAAKAYASYMGIDTSAPDAAPTRHGDWRWTDDRRGKNGCRQPGICPLQCRPVRSSYSWQL